MDRYQDEKAHLLSNLRTKTAEELEKILVGVVLGCSPLVDTGDMFYDFKRESLLYAHELLQSVQTLRADLQVLGEGAPKRLCQKKLQGLLDHLETLKQHWTYQVIHTLLTTCVAQGKSVVVLDGTSEQEALSGYEEVPSIGMLQSCLCAEAPRFHIFILKIDPRGVERVISHPEGMSLSVDHDVMESSLLRDKAISLLLKTKVGFNKNGVLAVRAADTNEMKE